nr:NAD(P)-dependent oxidoreductase [Haladaptatus sp. R4]
MDSWLERVAPALVVAATSDEECNAAIERAASERGILVNRADRSGERESGSVVVPATTATATWSRRRDRRAQSGTEQGTQETNRTGTGGGRNRRGGHERPARSTETKGRPPARTARRRSCGHRVGCRVERRGREKRERGSGCGRGTNSGVVTIRTAGARRTGPQPRRRRARPALARRRRRSISRRRGRTAEVPR